MQCTDRKKTVAAENERERVREIKRKRQRFLATEGDTANIPRVKIALDKTN